jgi:hypothetical protein
MGFKLEWMLERVPSRQRKAVGEILKNAQLDDTKFEYRVCVCPRCNTLSSRFWYRIEYNDGQVCESKPKCRRCRKNLAHVRGDHSRYSNMDSFLDNIDFSQYACRFCGAKELLGEADVDWD